MKIYLVGGAVRDQLLGLKPKERDWVVVGGDPQSLLDQGYQPVGKDFPVFLHPKSHEEYALARTERKTGPGYRGFDFYAAPDVTLEQDLIRRDLTINAIAQDEDGTLVDPYDGLADIQSKTLRHVSEAFAEDPLRVLRAARFAAKFRGFMVHSNTLRLMRQLVDSNELDTLAGERVWVETQKALVCPQPIRYFEVLNECGALASLLPDLSIIQTYQAALMRATIQTDRSDIRYAAILGNLDETAAGRISTQLSAPNNFSKLAELTARYQTQFTKALTLDAPSLGKLFQSLDVLRRPERFQDWCLVNQCLTEDQALAARLSAHLNKAATAYSKADISSALDQNLTGAELGAAIQSARIHAIHNKTKNT